MNLPLVHLVRTPRQPSPHPPLLVALHGYGANERQLLDLDRVLDPRFLILHARGPLTLAPHSYAWFQVTLTEDDFVVDPLEAQAALLRAAQFIEEAITAFSADPSSTYLLGFSQGAVTAGSLAIVRPDLVAGVALLGAGLPAAAVPFAAPADQLRHLHCFVAHGVDDQVVPIHRARADRDRLAALPVTLTYKEYAMGHGVNEESLADLSRWLTERLDSHEIAQRGNVS